jgi:hypothetical protein
MKRSDFQRGAIVSAQAAGVSTFDVKELKKAGIR